MQTSKFSCYNLFFDVEGKHYIYNTLSTALAQLDEKTFNAVQENNAALVDAAYAEEMLSQHFLVDSKVNETYEYLYFYNYVRFGGSMGKLSANFVPSYSCNLACPYCYQGQDKTNATVEIKDIDIILTFISKIIENSIMIGVPITEISAELYGGEPMLQKRALIQFSDGIKNIAEKYQCKFVFSMTSNMTLLDDDLIELIKKYQITVQVSIDGTKEQHDKRRVFADGSGTYDIILKNLLRLRDAGLKKLVTIRINIDKNNLDEAESIFKAVCEFSDDVYFGFLDTFKGYNDSFSSQCVYDHIYSNIETETFNAIYQKYGQPSTILFGKKSPCAMVCENSYLIDPLLNVYKCDLLLNRPEYSVGYIDRSGQLIKNAEFYKQMNRVPEIFPECLACKFLPICACGCAGKAAINDGTMNKPFCMYSEEKLIVFLKDYVKRTMVV
jgi:uncharacterized protein